MIDTPAAIAAVKAALLNHGGGGTQSHGGHRYHAFCIVCSGDVGAIAKVAVDAILAAVGSDTPTYERPALFQRVDFTLHSGKPLTWKIECDALTEADWDALAFIVSERFTFGSVLGVPRGGLPFAAALERYCTRGPRLIVDDVLTTGASMNDHRRPDLGDIGVVVFARGPVPDWITPLFAMPDRRVSSPHTDSSEATQPTERQQ